MVCLSPPSSLLSSSLFYHPGDGCIAKWSQSSCITEDTAGTATTASPAPAVTRSCLMEPVLSWTFTPLKMTTCWMGMLPPQVGYIWSPPWNVIIFRLRWAPTSSVHPEFPGSYSLHGLWRGKKTSGLKSFFFWSDDANMLARNPHLVYCPTSSLSHLTDIWNSQKDSLLPWFLRSTVCIFHHL